MYASSKVGSQERRQSTCFQRLYAFFLCSFYSSFLPFHLRLLLFHYSKREYLLAQIRQKDTIIESLLKQLHNPYLATPLSIASYKNAVNGAATGSSGDVSVVQWLDKLNSPTLSTTFNQVRNGNGMDDESASDEDDDEREGDDNDDDEDDDGERDREASAALPDSHVPLGLIANLSLTTQRGKRSRRGRGRGGANLASSSGTAKQGTSTNGKTPDEEDIDDENVGVANEGYFMPGKHSHT